MEIVIHHRPGAYAKSLLAAPQLNTFLVRVSSRQSQLSPAIILRDTVIWAHASQADVITGVSKTRRFEQEGRQIIERALVFFTTHSGLQTQPRRFARQTTLLGRVVR